MAADADASPQRSINRAACVSKMLKARIHWFALHRKGAEDAFVHRAQGLALNGPLESLDAEGEFS